MVKCSNCQVEGHNKRNKNCPFKVAEREVVDAVMSRDPILNAENYSADESSRSSSSFSSSFSSGISSRVLMNDSEIERLRGSGESESDEYDSDDGPRGPIPYDPDNPDHTILTDSDGGNAADVQWERGYAWKRSRV